MTAQILTTELSTLIQESKRKNPELRAAAEKSLNDLNALSRTSEAQVVADLRARPAFVRPFLIACNTRHPKLATSATVCLQRLIAANALPRESLGGTLQALKECATLALDIQLKVLQALPSLLQHYGNDLTRDLLAAAYQISFLLYGNKAAVVSNLAAAGLKQLVDLTFDKASHQVQASQSGDETPVLRNHQTTDRSVIDAAEVLDDICALLQGGNPMFIAEASLTPSFLLELLESIIEKYSQYLKFSQDSIRTLRERLVPFVVKIISEKTSFSTTVRCMRISNVILIDFVSTIPEDCETILSILSHTIDAETAPTWKRAISLEIFRNLHQDFPLVRSMFEIFDEIPERRNVVKDHLSSLVRLAAEKPALIGLGNQSSVPSASFDDAGEQAALQAGGLVGSIGASTYEIDLSTPGISNLWSNVKTACIELVDKNEPPALPATYVYRLVLACVTLFEEGVARSLLPYTVPVQKRVKRKIKKVPSALEPDTDPPEDGPLDEDASAKTAYERKAPVNPLNLKEHAQYPQIKTMAHMADQCWPALLAASSTFFNSALDSENFHALLRAFQKFTQIAGLLDLVTPRDAFLTTLGKNAVPLSPSKKTTTATPSLGSHPEPSDHRLSEKARPSTPNVPTSLKASTAPEGSFNAVTSRHLLCLRALLNLGIALGPVLHDSWSIILEVLHRSDLLLHEQSQTNFSSRSKSLSDGPIATGEADAPDDVGPEITAAHTAASRLFESSCELREEAFLSMLNCLCKPLLQEVLSKTETLKPSDSLSPLSPSGNFGHKKMRSASGAFLESSEALNENIVVLDRVKDIIQCNIPRLVRTPPSKSGWDMLLSTLLRLLGTSTLPSQLRLKAAYSLNEMVVLTATSDLLMPGTTPKVIEARALGVLSQQISTVAGTDSSVARSTSGCDQELQLAALKALRTILDHSGEALTEGWPDVLRVILSVFQKPSDPQRVEPGMVAYLPRSLPLLRGSFDCLQLICSDFLLSVPRSCFSQFLDTLKYFTMQPYDLNVSLTTTTYFRQLSDSLLRDRDDVTMNLQDEKIPDSTSKLGDEDNARRESVQALWLSLLITLKTLTNDARMETRRSVLHTLFRILDGQNAQLGETGVLLLYTQILKPILLINDEKYMHLAADSNESRSQEGDLIQWNQTGVIIIQESVALVMQWTEKHRSIEMISKIVLEFIEKLQPYLSRKDLKVSQATFEGLTSLLRNLHGEALSNEAVREVVWRTWSENNPVTYSQPAGKIEDNSNAVIAYLSLLEQVLSLHPARALGRPKWGAILDLLQQCLDRTSVSRYHSDVDSMTAVQKAVLECTRKLPTIDQRSDELLAKHLAHLLLLPFESERSLVSTSTSFVALAKASMTLSEAFLKDRIVLRDAQGWMQLAGKIVDALSTPIHLKYKWRKIGREPSTWKKATSTATSIIKSSCALSVPSNETEFWTHGVAIFDGIVKADCESCSKETDISLDEQFDIGEVQGLTDILIERLGSAEVPNKTRQNFVEAIFHSSLLHQPHPDDLARPEETLLEGLKRDHIGRVNDLTPSPRKKMAYLLVDLLYRISQANEQTSPAQVRLAKAAAPYLILRTGVVLRSYICDQPLRGKMPQPRSQRDELLYLLQKLNGFKSEPGAFPASSAIESKHKKHLYLLYPFLLKAYRTAWRDQAIMKAIDHVLESLSGDFEM